VKGIDVGECVGPQCKTCGSEYGWHGTLGRNRVGSVTIPVTPYCRPRVEILGELREAPASFHVEAGWWKFAKREGKGAIALIHQLAFRRPVWAKDVGVKPVKDIVANLLKTGIGCQDLLKGGSELARCLRTTRATVERATSVLGECSDTIEQAWGISRPTPSVGLGAACIIVYKRHARRISHNRESFHVPPVLWVVGAMMTTTKKERITARRLARASA
jgi:hypothetical protein